MTETATVTRNTTPGLLDRNTAKCLSPFMYMAIAMTVIDNSQRKREARRSRSVFGVGLEPF